MSPIIAKPVRTAIYAHYSSDSQSEQSIDDQVRICRAKAEREGWSVTGVYADYAISGTVAGRPQFERILAEARAGLFDIVLAEALDRISRDQEHIAGFYKQLTFAGVQIYTLAEGDISELHVGLKGTMAALFLKDLAQKTHRGLEGRVRGGHSGGGLSFGYRIVREARADGSQTTGAMDIIEAEAVIIRGIFDAYAGGRSPRAIAKALNTAGVTGPRGGRWSASLILGNAARETGILRNRLYAGERVWNRQHFIKDPTSGKRVARPNPRDGWVVSPVPALRIIEPALWDTVQQRLADNRRAVTGDQPTTSEAVDGDRPSRSRGASLLAVRRPPWLLSGLVRCGACGGTMTVVGEHGRLGCANHRERGTCTNRRTVLRDGVLVRVLAGLKHRLLAPELVEVFVAEYVAEVNRANHDAVHRRSQLQTTLARVERQMSTIVRTIADTGGSRTLVAELRSLETRQDALGAEIVAAGTPEPVPALHPNLAKVYRQKVECLEQALADPIVSAAAVEALRSLVDAIIVHPGERRGEVTLELRGDLAAFLHLDTEGAAAGRPGRGRAAPGVGNVGSGEVVGSLVAGARNHLDLLLTG